MVKHRIPLCDVCGNEVDAGAVQCPYCGVKRSASQYKIDAPGFRIVNLEKGMPAARDALQRMHNELEAARLHGLRVLILIHGYGSSGTGGTIRDEVRRQLHYLLAGKEINDFMPGEDFDRRSGRFRQLVRRFSFLGSLIRRPNPGITIIII